MTMTLDSIIQTLTQIETEHPDTAERLAPIIRLLAGDASAMLTVDEAARLLGSSPAGVVYRLEPGLLPGERDQATGGWHLPLAEIVRQRAWLEALAAMPGEDLTADELADLSSTRPGSLPWQRAT
jgi:hypothetical protein